jgi:hypothetical protein
LVCCFLSCSFVVVWLFGGELMVGWQVIVSWGAVWSVDWLVGCCLDGRFLWSLLLCCCCCFCCCSISKIVFPLKRVKFTRTVQFCTSKIK